MSEVDVLTRATGLSLADLRRANVTRQKEWDTLGQLTLAYRGNELAGEVGEACNVIKKLEREKLGINGSRDTVEHLAEELADVIICADLIAMQAGINLDAAVIAKFNTSSEKVGLTTRLSATTGTAVDREALARLIDPSAWEADDHDYGVYEVTRRIARSLDTADAILSLLRPAEPVEAVRGDGWRADCPKCVASKFTCDEHTAHCTTTPDAVEPVAWSIIFSDHYGVNPETTFKTREKAKLYVKSVGRGRIVPLYTHPPAQPDTSAAVLQSLALEQALNSLAEIASSSIPDCPSYYSGDELAWAQRHVSALRHKAEIARDGIAAAIR